MILTALMIAGLIGPGTGPTDPPQVFSGRNRQLSVRAPRVDTEITVDGTLDEPVWAHAALLTDYGYEVEIRIPFKSLRFQPAREQSWNINIVRQVKHSNFEDSWAPALRASPSFLGQSGEMVGLVGLHRGLVMDLNPEATQRV